MIGDGDCRACIDCRLSDIDGRTVDTFVLAERHRRIAHLSSKERQELDDIMAHLPSDTRASVVEQVKPLSERVAEMMDAVESASRPGRW